MGQISHENFMRKLHSLSGIIPLGLFIPFHYVLNFTALWGEDVYDVAAGFMGKIPFVYLLEIFIIFLPLLFHGIYGVYIAFQAKNNVRTYKYARNWFFYLQRLTGILAFLFVIWHVWETRAQIAIGAASEANFSMMAEIVANPLSLAFYMIGIVSAAFHFTNGIWTFLITWGITCSPKSQKISKYITVLCFFLLAFIGVRAILAFV